MSRFLLRMNSTENYVMCCSTVNIWNTNRGTYRYFITNPAGHGNELFTDDCQNRIVRIPGRIQFPISKFMGNTFDSIENGMTSIFACCILCYHNVKDELTV